MGASGVYRLVRTPPAPQPRFVERSIMVDAVLGDQVTSARVKLAYLDYAPAARPDAPVVVLLHGSPGSASNFAGLAPLLSGVCPPPGTRSGGFGNRTVNCPDAPPAQPYRVIAPDLPGFDRSDRNIPDYSFRAHAFYLRQMMDQLGIAKAHLVGYSMGGGPAFNLHDIAPERVASITLLSSLGVQEFELTGDYHLNRMIHGAQLGFFWFLQHLTPHFGFFDDNSGVPFSLNFFQSDQRPLREFMQRYEKPLLIMQGMQDGQVPPEAAYEHHRIVPHSELKMFDSGHGMVFGEPEMLAPVLLDFFDRAEAGRAPTRAQADPTRVAEAARPVAMAPMIGIATFAVAILIALMGIVSPELAALFAGILLAQGRVDVAPAILAAIAGVFAGDLLVFKLARRLGVLRWLAPTSEVQHGRDTFAQRGPLRNVLERFVYSRRVASYTGARLAGARGWRMAPAVLFGALLWTPLLAGLGAIAGRAVVTPLFSYNLFGGLVLVFVAVFAGLRVLAKRLAPTTN